MVTTIDDYNKVIDKIPLLLQNTVWSGCKISNNEIIGLVIAVGKNTRLTKNSKNIKINKTTYVDNKVEFFSFCLFLMMFLISIMNSLYQGTLFISLTAFIVSTVRFIILLSFLIPISLKLFLIGARMAYSHQIQSDKEIPGVIAKNETIVDELGKIDIVLSDKTGTITKNEMIMENISMGDQSYEAQRFKQLLSSDIKHGSGEFLEFALALAICNNVYMEIGDNNKPIFNASSPDEIAMVQFVEQIGLQFLQRDDNKIVFKDFTNKIYEYKIIKNFPFESAKKKMGLIVSYQDKNETKYKFYIKGADSIIKEKINSQNDKYFLEEMTLQMAYQGLRTLCFACKDLTHQQIQQFLEQQKQNLLKGKKKRNDELENQLEQNCSYLGITGVKDLLQENMPQSISNFDQAMVKVWILTGDKLETAAHICQCIGLVNRKRTLEKIQGINNRELDYLIESKLKTSSLEQYQKVLLVDGAVLETAMQNNIRRFLRFCLSHKFVCFARCSPIQKYNIAKILKEDLKQIVLAVGDGGNDVGMIQKSNIGIGIYGKEGNQAALAADFTITEFQHLSKMIFFHGRRAFMGLSSISQFILHRGLIISWIQEIFSACFFMISLPVYNGFMMVTYSGLFTILPVFSVIYDYDVSWNKLQQYLRSYKESSQGMEIKYFLIWNLISLYQAVAIVVSGFLLFNNFFNNFVEITFTALILAETFNIVLLVPRCSKWLFWSIAITFLLYIFCVFVFPTQFSINNFSLFFFANVFKIFVISWLPVFIFQMIMKSLNKDLTDL